ncbi:hypothetical protein BD408DRAFT_414608 [Parasitella parasitica]|nr:hypothetical protein BD408DRAFT_414608 [Parasitella parasitica]
MLLLYTLIFDYLRCKRMHFVFIIAGIIRYTTSLIVGKSSFFFKSKSITRKQSTGWRVPSAVIHSVWFSLHVKWMAYH